MKLILLITLTASALFLSGCAGPNPYGVASEQYKQSETNQGLQLTYGTIIDLTAVNIDSEGNVIGKMAGGLIGGLAASGVGGGRGSDIAAVAGAVIGGMVGNKAQLMINKENGVQITVQLDNGEVKAVVQAVNAEVLFNKGDRVKLISDAAGKVRVSQ